MGFQYRALSQKRVNLNGPAFIVGSTGLGIGGEYSINRYKMIRSVAPARVGFYISTANVLSGGVGRYGSRMFDSNADGLNIFEVTKAQPWRLKRMGLW